MQAGDFELHVHVQDAASTDHTSERCRSLAVLARGGGQKEYQTDVRQPARSSLYDGITQAFETFQPSDDTVMTWLGSDDVLMPGALATVKSVLDDLSADQMADWIDLYCRLRRLQ